MKDKTENSERGSQKASPPRITIIGTGNVLLSDEGIGVYIAKEMMKMDLPPNVEVIEGGTDGFGLLNFIMDTDHLIIIDSLKGDSDPGTIYKFDIREAPDTPDMYKTSVHQIGILEVINLSGLVGPAPEATVFGIEPKKLTAGMEISPEILAKVPRVIELVQEEIARVTSNTPKQ